MSGLKYKENGFTWKASSLALPKSKKCLSMNTQDLRESIQNSLHWWKKLLQSQTLLKQCQYKDYKKHCKDSVICWPTSKKHWVIIWKLKEQPLLDFISLVMRTYFKLSVTAKMWPLSNAISQRCMLVSPHWQMKKPMEMITFWKCQAEKVKSSTLRNQFVSLKIPKSTSGWRKSITKWDSHLLLI